MQNKEELVNALNQELSIFKNDISENEIFNSFQIFVQDKNALRFIIEAGALRYDYIKYNILFKETIFEEGIKLITDMCHEANSRNPTIFKTVMLENRQKIAKGIENNLFLAWLDETKCESKRNDLIIKDIFGLLGDMIENSFKPYAVFINQLRALIQNKTVNQKKLGTVVDALISYNDIFKGILKNYY